MATLFIKILAGDAPSLQVTVPAGTVPTGTQMTVRGRTASGWTWLVRGGQVVSTGSQVVLLDPLAPVNQQITYECATASGVVAVSGSLRRPWTGYSLLTDVTNTAKVNLVWQGDDTRTIDRRQTLHTIPGQPTPVPVMAPTMGAGDLTLTARTSTQDTPTLLALAASPGVVALLHNPARCWWCQRGVCDVQPVTVLALTSVSHARTARPDAAERSWSLKGAVVAVPEPTRALASSSWDDLDRVRWSWNMLDSRRLRWDTFDAMVWQEVGH